MAFINLSQLRLPFQVSTLSTQKKEETVVPEKKEPEAQESKKESYVNTVRTPSLSLQQSNLLAQQATIKVDLSNVTANQESAETVENETKASASDSAHQLTEEEAVAQGYTVIKSAEDLKKINDNLDGKYILMGDIDMSEVEAYSLIGTEDNPFTGVFNGNGYTISNFTDAIFDYADGANIKNVKLSNQNSEHFGSLISTAKNSTIVNCDLENTILAGYIENTTVEDCTANLTHTGNGAYWSGLISTASNSVIKDCEVNANGKFKAGLLWQATDTVIKDCSTNINGNGDAGLVCKANNSEIINSHSTVNGRYSAGLVYEAVDTKITDCTTSGNIEGNRELDKWTESTNAYTNPSGGIAAKISGNSEISGCSSSMNITATLYGTGGIVGSIQGDASISNCEYNGTITNNDSKKAKEVGGIAGVVLEGNAEIENCTVKDASISGEYNIGGILGSVYYGGNATVEGCNIENSNINGFNIGAIIGCNTFSPKEYDYDATSNIILNNNNVNDVTIIIRDDHTCAGGLMGVGDCNLILGDNTVNNLKIQDPKGNVVSPLPDTGNADTNYKGRLFGYYTGVIQELPDDKTYKFPDLIDMVQDRKDMEAAAKKQNLSPSDCNGVYQKRINGKTVYYVWNSNDKEFELAGDIQSINSDGTYTDRYGNKYNRPYNEQVAAHAGGYTPTVVEGVYEKDGKYYNFNNGTGEFVEIDKSNFEVETPDLINISNNFQTINNLDLETKKHTVILNNTSEVKFASSTTRQTQQTNEKDDNNEENNKTNTKTTGNLTFKGFVSLSGYSQPTSRFRTIKRN